MWEQPLNHLNLKSKVQVRVYRAGQTSDPVSVYEAVGIVTNQPIGTVMSTSSGFIKEMNKISNSFAVTLSNDILDNVRKQVVR